MIHTLTLNPAIDMILYLPEFVRNVTNRIREVKKTMGGKGTHVSMDLALMGSPSNAFGFGFGRNGLEIISMLEAAGVTPRFVYSESGESRVNYMLVEEIARDCTLIADRGPSPTNHMVDELCEMMVSRVSPGDFIALSGDTSNFPDPEIYSRIIDLLSPKRPRIFLDASGESLRRGAQKKPFLLKPNADELSMLTGLPTGSERDVIRAISALDPLQIEVIAVSLGGDGSIVRVGDALYRLRPPKVAVLNTVGCGDCFVAGLLHGFSEGFDVPHVLTYATAVSAAAAETALSVGFDVSRAKALLSAVLIEKI